MGFPRATWQHHHSALSLYVIYDVVAHANLTIRGPFSPLQWCHNKRDGVSNHRRLDCLVNLLFRRRSKKTSKLHVTGLCEGNSPVTGGFCTQKASNAENISIWWRHHEYIYQSLMFYQNNVSDIGIWPSKYIPEISVGCNYSPTA